MELDDDPGLQKELANLLRRKRAVELAAELDAGAQPSLGLMSGARVRERQDVPQLVEGVLPEGALFQVFGETGSFKSFVILDLALSIANGLPWMGHEVRSPGPVALVLGEGGADAGAREQAWLDAHPGASDYLLAWSVEQQLDLMLPGHVDAIIDDLHKHRDARHADQPWRMVVFDTQADHMPSGDEDRARDFTVVKRSIQRISQETGAAVGLVHHTGWDKSRERGSSRQRQALDVVMQVDNRTITNIKQKSGRLFDRIHFETVAMTGSLFVRSRTKEEMLAEGAEQFARDQEDGRELVRALIGDSTFTGNRLMKTFGWGKPKLDQVLEVVAGSGYLTITRNGPGRPVTLEVTDDGRAWASE